jgi:aryl-alcohol dehydrogenase-like predicted oxidoreductase
MIPFCEAEGIGLRPWSPVARGLLTRPASEETSRSEQDVKTKRWFQGENNCIIIQRVEEIAKAKGCSMANLALAWLLHRGECPIVGLNSESRIESASEVFKISLKKEDVEYLEAPYRPLEVQAM